MTQLRETCDVVIGLPLLRGFRKFVGTTVRFSGLMQQKAKVVLVGAAHTGKTSIANRFVYGEFSPNTFPTIQPAFFQKGVQTNGTEVMLEIWDTAGQEQYRSLSPLFYRDADVGIVVFDLADSSSFGKCKQWVTDLREARGLDIAIVLVGNKLDLPSIRTVSFESVAQFATSINVETVETSAKTGENIRLLFETVAKQILKRNVPKGAKKPGARLDSDSESNCC
jgi:small GTP-binding protein